LPADHDGRVRLDLSHVVEDGMTTYRGLPVPVISDFLSREQSRGTYAPGTEFLIGRIDLCGNTGTYVDSPFHRYADGTDLAALPLQRLADLDGLTIDVTAAAERPVDRSWFLPHDVAGKAVLVHTGWDRNWRTDAYFEGHPFLTEDAARHLADNGAVLVGIDSLNIDDTSGGERPAHSTLLRAGIPICEHLTNLGGLPADGYRFSAVPVKVRGMGTFPVRAYATWLVEGGVREGGSRS
jgi:kynurenine formamidase